MYLSVLYSLYYIPLGIAIYFYEIDEITTATTISVAIVSSHFVAGTILYFVEGHSKALERFSGRTGKVLLIANVVLLVSFVFGVTSLLSDVDLHLLTLILAIVGNLGCLYSNCVQSQS